MNVVELFKKINWTRGPVFVLLLYGVFPTLVAAPRRSPINFSRSLMVARSLENIHLNYDRQTSLFFDLRGGRMAQGGRRVLLKVLQENNLILQGKKFRLVFIDFKKPSEHVIDWKHFPVEVQFVHKNEIDGQMLVVVVFLQQNLRHSFDKHPMLSRLLHVMGGQDARLEDINLVDLFPKNKSYFWYKGSLTVPPFTDNVTWIVYQNPIDVAQEQLDQIASMVDGDNNQNVPALENQTVYRSASE